jgi:hypothetical protein
VFHEPLRLHHWFAALLAFTAIDAGAQTTVLDGVHAIARGDYDAAAKILTPLADTNEHPDPIAQFFLGLLAETGRGVARNSVRACGLYARSGTAESPLAARARALARYYQDASALMRSQCADAAALPWATTPVDTITLAADHWVRRDDDGLTVAYHGQERRLPMPLSGPGLTHLNLRHTALQVRRPARIRRDFVSVFFWVPVPNVEPRHWGLIWMLYEIRGLDLQMVRGGPIVTVAGTDPPVSFDVDAVAQVRVNEDGDAEWFAPASADPRPVPIADRR